jgi:hypothetical protein
MKQKKKKNLKYNYDSLVPYDKHILFIQLFVQLFVLTAMSGLNVDDMVVSVSTDRVLLSSLLTMTTMITAAAAAVVVADVVVCCHQEYLLKLYRHPPHSSHHFPPLPPRHITNLRRKAAIAVPPVYATTATVGFVLFHRRIHHPPRTLHDDVDNYKK